MLTLRDLLKRLDPTFTFIVLSIICAFMVYEFFLLAGGNGVRSHTLIYLSERHLSHIQLDGYAPEECLKTDIFATRFHAFDIHGHLVSGAVCSGWFSNSRIRYDL